MGTISVEHGNRLFWLGRYTERVFTTLKAMEKLYDKALDDESAYAEYLGSFGLPDSFGRDMEFFKTFIFDKNNVNSAAYALERAYDNGIVLREEISTESLSFLQMAMDKLEGSEGSTQSLRLALLPLGDTLYGFWGCIADNIIDMEIKSIMYCGKSIERLDLYFRLKYPFYAINEEFDRLCWALQSVPRKSPYRYNVKQLSTLTEIMGEGDKYTDYVDSALYSLGHLFEPNH